MAGQEEVVAPVLAQPPREIRRGEHSLIQNAVPSIVRVSIPEYL